MTYIPSYPPSTDVNRDWLPEWIPEVSPPDKLPEYIAQPGGTLEILHSNGDVEYRYRNGTNLKIFPDGTNRSGQFSTFGPGTETVPIPGDGWKIWGEKKYPKNPGENPDFVPPPIPPGPQEDYPWPKNPFQHAYLGNRLSGAAEDFGLAKDIPGPPTPRDLSLLGFSFPLLPFLLANMKGYEEEA
jgi:hypothetical protein